MSTEAQFKASLDLQQLSKEGRRIGSDDNFLDQFISMQKSGKQAIRLLPPTEGGSLFQYNRIHVINGRRLHCPRPLSNGKFDHTVPCPICEYIRSLWKKSDELEKQGDMEGAERLRDEARRLAANERYYYNSVDRMHTTKDNVVVRNCGPRILSVGKILHRKIVTGIVGDSSERGYGNVTDLQNGRDFIISIGRKGEYPDYGDSRFALDSSPAGTEEEIAKWRQGLHDLTKLRNPKSYEELEKQLAIYKGFIPDDSEYDLEALQRKYQPTEEADTAESAPADEAPRVEIVSDSDNAPVEVQEPKFGEDFEIDPAFLN